MFLVAVALVFRDNRRFELGMVTTFQRYCETKLCNRMGTRQQRTSRYTFILRSMIVLVIGLSMCGFAFVRERTRVKPPRKQPCFGISVDCTRVTMHIKERTSYLLVLLE